jgi:hypothetical protein
MEVIIHVGLHKTGSTSIQYVCERNQSKLRNSGYYYPVFHINDRNIFNHSIPFYSLFTENPGKYPMNIRWGVDPDYANTEYRKQFDALFERSGKILISGEDISNLSEVALQTLKDEIVKKGGIIRIIAYIRSPMSSEASSVQHRVRCGVTIKANTNPEIVNKIKKLQSVFQDQVEFHTFKEACQHPYGPAGHFLELIGIPGKDIGTYDYSKRNEALSAQATRLISYINSVEPLIVNGKINANREVGDTDAFNIICGDKFKLTPEELAPVVRIIEEQNNWLKKNLGSEFCDTEPLDDKFPCNEWSTKSLMGLEESLLRCSDNVVYLAFDYFENYCELSDTDRNVIDYIIAKVREQRKDTPLDITSDIFVDTLRDAAIEIEEKDLQKAYYLMSLAHLGRPEGPSISKKLDEYQEKLSVPDN